MSSEEMASARRAALQAFVQTQTDPSLTASSGCAAAGSARHRAALVEQAVIALARWESGQGSVCAGCGEPIGAERLAAVLTATTCVRC